MPLKPLKKGLNIDQSKLFKAPQIKRSVENNKKPHTKDPIKTISGYICFLQWNLRFPKTHIYIDVYWLLSDKGLTEQEIRNREIMEYKANHHHGSFLTDAERGED